jgi:molybdate/tungstate transport system permease protein
VLSVVVALAASLFLLFLAAPLLGLVGAGGASGVRLLGSDAELRGALALTAGTATLATLLAIAGATPVAYALARGRFRGRAVLAAVIDLPLLIPHPVAGLALLLVVGQSSPVDSRWRALRRVTLPLAWRGLLAASIVMWARAVSEFGAIVVLVYHPKIASVLSYERFTAFGLRSALPVAAVLVLLALVPLVLLRALRGDERLPSRRR